MIAVRDIDVGTSGHVRDLEGLGDAQYVLATVRWRGVPLGQLTLPVANATCRADRVAHAILTRHEAAILRCALRTTLETVGLAGTPALAEVPARSSPGNTSPLPRITVAVCTRNRPEDLRQCLGALVRLDYPDLELLVVDNSELGTAQSIVRSFDRVRYAVEPCPGLNWARRHAVETSRGQVLAFVDDDVVVEPGWAATVGRLFAESADVMGVTTLVLPLELQHRAQALFERGGGLGRGFERRWIRRPLTELTSRRFANAGPFGVGAAMAFRRTLFADVGSFDPALGAGTATGGGDDLDMFFRVLKAGHTLVYEPAAVVRHRHRRELSEVISQMESWSRGMLAYLERTGCTYPDEAPLASALARRLITLHYPRRMLQALLDPRLSLELATAEWRGARSGRRQYHRSRQRAQELAAAFHRRSDPPAVARPPALRQAGERLAWRTQVALDDPLPQALSNPHGRDVVQVTVTRAGRQLATLEVVTGGHPIGRARLADTIAAATYQTLIAPDHPWRAELRNWLAASL